MTTKDDVTARNAALRAKGVSADLTIELIYLIAFPDGVRKTVHECEH